MANKNKNSNPLGGINFLHNPIQSFMASKTSNGHWLKVNSTYHLRTGKWKVWGKKENSV